MSRAPPHLCSQGLEASLVNRRCSVSICWMTVRILKDLLSKIHSFSYSAKHWHGRNPCEQVIQSPPSHTLYSSRDRQTEIKEQINNKDLFREWSVLQENIQADWVGSHLKGLQIRWPEKAPLARESMPWNTRSRRAVMSLGCPRDGSNKKEVSEHSREWSVTANAQREARSGS